jgi:hypothetical protein
MPAQGVLGLDGMVNIYEPTGYPHPQPAFGVAAGAVSSRALWALVPDPTPRQAGEQIAESVAVHQAVVAHVSLENCWTEPP